MHRSPVVYIVALNLLVFLGWAFALDEAILSFMMSNFVLSYASAVAGRPWTLITSVFSHASFFHLMLNMMALISFSRVMQPFMGRLNYTIFYLIAGLSGSMAHILTSAFLIGNPFMGALGASGAVSGIILLFSLLFPEERLLLMGIIPIRAIWGAVFFIGLDVWGLITQSHGGGLPIGHGAHLGGALIGIIYFFILRHRRSRALQESIKVRFDT